MKALALVVLLMLPLVSEAGFPLTAKTVGVPAAVSTASARQDGPMCAARYTKGSTPVNILSNEEHVKNNHISTLSFLLALGGLLSICAAIIFLPASLTGALVMSAIAMLFGLSALGTGYVAVAHKHQTTLGTIGFFTGMVEALPLLLVGGFFVSVWEIGRFVFRKRHKKPVSD